MFLKIKNKIEAELINYARQSEQLYSLHKVSGILFKHIKNFILREGKRIRPILFIAGYRGFCNRTPQGFYRSAISLELLHDFMLIHDDVIDKSKTRRGKPSMHTMLASYLSKSKGAKFSGEDLSIVIGDIIYAMSLQAFLSINEKYEAKEKALRILTDAAMRTGSGEFIELLAGLKSIGRINKNDIYKIYDLKTAYYTFSAPLIMGATLAGAGKKEIKKLYDYGIHLGRAFQIKDDILDMFGDEKETGKSTLTDLKEAKKTLLIWYAYKKASRKQKIFIKKIMSRENPNKPDLEKIRVITEETGALDYCKNEISASIKKAKKTISSSTIKPQYKEMLRSYSEEILELGWLFAPTL